MVNRCRITTELLDLLDEVAERYHLDHDDPEIVILVASAQAIGGIADRSLQEIALLARRGHNAPRPKELDRDRRALDLAQESHP